MTGAALIAKHARGAELEDSLGELRALVTELARLLTIATPTTPDQICGTLIVQHFHGPVNTVSARDTRIRN